ncbi:MAG: hypothetical protein K6E62_00865 [Lachnospiraceae bacterium]|nr:hypothetical protein [Lachnospiraceae bacterium]
MNRSRSKGIKQFIIDLTPLLDVIFILLIVVLANGTRSEELANEQFEEAMEVKSSAEQQVNAYKSHFEAYSDIDEYFSIITVSAGYHSDNRRERTISIKVNENDEIQFELNPVNQDDQWEKITQDIQKTISAKNDLPAILVLNIKNDEKMLYRDEEAIMRIFDGLKTEYPQNVEIRR